MYWVGGGAPKGMSRHRTVSVNASNHTYMKDHTAWTRESHEMVSKSVWMVKKQPNMRIYVDGRLTRTSPPHDRGLHTKQYIRYHIYFQSWLGRLATRGHRARSLNRGQASQKVALPRNPLVGLFIAPRQQRNCQPKQEGLSSFHSLGSHVVSSPEVGVPDDGKHPAIRDRHQASRRAAAEVTPVQLQLPRLIRQHLQKIIRFFFPTGATNEQGALILLSQRGRKAGKEL